MVVTALRYDISIPYEYMCSCSVEVIICALHAQGPQFDPGQEHSLFDSYSISKYCNIPRHYVTKSMQPGFCSVVVITCASHAQGPQFIY